MNGDDYKKLLSDLPNKLCFLVNNNTHDLAVDLWRSFGELYKYISQDAIAATPAVQVFEKCRSWLPLFKSVGKGGRIGYDSVTPYMHCLVYHVPFFFVEKFGNLSLYSGHHDLFNGKVKFSN